MSIRDNSNDSASHPAPAKGVGVLFTPVAECRRIVKRFGLAKAWLEGATLMDPTAGEGNFLLASVEEALSAGVSSADLPLERLRGVEIQPEFAAAFHARLRALCGRSLPPGNFLVKDFLCQPLPWRADHLVGNPPWCNFCDLPEAYKEALKPLYKSSGVAPRADRLLLGSARVDIAALVAQLAVERNLKTGGTAILLLPLSLFFNDGAHDRFRRYRTGDGPFALEELYNYQRKPIFGPDGPDTDFGLAVFRKGKVRREAKYFELTGEDWRRASYSLPADSNAVPLLSIDSASRPRQGCNTCGANRILIFTDCDGEGETVRAVNGEGEAVELERRLLYPLLRDPAEASLAQPSRWILLPHYPRSGKPLAEDQLAEYPAAYAYLSANRDRLMARKGSMLRGMLDRGRWYALLGVGPYSFTKWKVVWKAYGGKRFQAVVVSHPSGWGPWQGNQALHGLMPFTSRRKASRVAAFLNSAKVRKVIESSPVVGNRSWAQPGRISRFFDSR